MPVEVPDDAGVEVDVERRGVDDAARGGGCGRGGPAQGGADPGEELLGAEGLAEVVVGTGVERLHLVRLVLPGGEHDHRAAGTSCGRRAARPCRRGRAGRGRAARRRGGPGRLPRGPSRRPARRPPPTPATAARARGCGAGSASSSTSRTVVTRLPAATGTESSTVSPPPAVPSSSSPTPIASQKPADDGHAQAEPAGAGVVEALERDEHLRAPLHGDARPVVHDGQPHSAGAGASRRPAHDLHRGAVAVGERVRHEVGQDAFEQHGVGEQRGQVLGHVERDAPRRGVEQRARPPPRRRVPVAGARRAPRSGAGTGRAGWRRVRRAGPRPTRCPPAAGLLLRGERWRQGCAGPRRRP